MAYIRRKLADIAVATNMDAFKSMKKKLVLTFGESNVQIVRLDEEEIERRLADSGHRPPTLRQIDISAFKQIVDLSSALYFITIRLPEVKVSNSRGESITIRDMFVRLRVRPDGTLVSRVEGLVASYTKRQALARYQHSHLHALPDELRSKPFFDNFCLGTGPINQVLALLARGQRPATLFSYQKLGRVGIPGRNPLYAPGWSWIFRREFGRSSTSCSAYYQYGMRKNQKALLRNASCSI
jgi:hypothetical protein